MSKDEWLNFEIGDIVSRDGTDEQKIEKINEGGDLITVRCIKSSGWCSVGETEENLAWRYNLVRKATKNR